MEKIICFFKGHKRGNTRCKSNRYCVQWFIECERCGYEVNYSSPRVRLVAVEINLGFDGN